ncbi:MAG: PAS domain S-box protein [Syntrophales bacterium]|nr:PAS domain S-box protein [Syntrophales bacterium]
MRQSLSCEALKRKVTDLEKRLKESEQKVIQQDIHEATKRFEKIAEMGDDGIIVFDEAYRIEFANTVASELTGYPKEKLIGKDFRCLLIEGDIGYLAQMHSGLGADESKRLCTGMEIITSSGTKRDAEVCITIEKLEQGGVRTYAYLRDITERKKYERDLKESEEKYRNLFERVRHGLYISTNEGRFLDCNQALLEMLGYQDKNEFLQIDIAKDLYMRPEDRTAFQGLIEKQEFVKELELEFKKKNGEKITVLVTAHAKRDEKGTIIGYEGIMNDVSERKRMERELREANEFLTNLIESSVDAIFVTDMKGNILIFNRGAENILGYTAGEVVGKMNISNIYPPGVAREVMKKLKMPDFGGVGKLTSFPITQRRKDGELIEGDLSASIIYNGGGKEVASVGIFKDLRERLRIERELQKTQQALLQSEKLAAMGRLTSQVAHELNNPIYGIMNTLELLKTEIPPQSKRRRILELSLSETQRLSEMLRNMLSFSKPEEEKRTPIRINELIEEILSVMEKQMRESNIKVETYLDSKIPEVMASTNQMRQVMLNIIKNAMEAMPKGGTLTVRTAREKKNVLIHIQDTGIGIPEEIRDKIFEAFFTTKQKVKGVGLGLSVCYGIIKGHGGEIRVDGEEGKGTTFTIGLPI